MFGPFLILSLCRAYIVLAFSKLLVLSIAGEVNAQPVPYEASQCLTRGETASKHPSNVVIIILLNFFIAYTILLTGGYTLCSRNIVGHGA